MITKYLKNARFNQDSICQYEIEFPDLVQVVPVKLGCGTKCDIRIPTKLQIKKGMPMPRIIKIQEPLSQYKGTVPVSLIGFNESRSLYNKGIEVSSCIHFFLYDNLFSCILNNPVKYTAMFLSSSCLISTDFSVYMNWTEHDRRQSVWRNQTLERLWRYNGINVITNVSWAGPDSYSYCFQFIPKNDVIAINSMGIKGDPDAVYFWHKGYDFVLSHLSPKLILRYGEKMDGENEYISKYFHKDRKSVV